MNKIGFCLFMLVVCCYSRFVGLFQNFVPSLEIKNAVFYALSILDENIVLACDLRVNIYGYNFYDKGSIAKGYPSYYCFQDDNNIMIPASLYAHQHNGEACMLDFRNDHITIEINMDDWIFPWLYLKTDGRTPSGYIDFVTVLLHECMHGLGFHSGIENAFGKNKFAPHLSLYDYYVFSDYLRFPFNATYPIHFSATHLLTEGPLFFKGKNTSFPLYTPRMFIYGKSIVHTQQSGLVNALIYVGKSIHCLTEECLIFLRTFGYDMSPQISSCVSSSSVLNCFWIF